MARTIVGILQILLKQDVTKEAPAVNQAIGSIERAANRLGNSKWGTGFQRQLDKLKVTPAEAAAIQQSYSRLATGINGKIGKTDLANWRHGVLGHLTAVRAGMQSTERETRKLGATIRRTFTGGVLAGVTGISVYSGVRGGGEAAFEQQRAEATAKFAGLPEEDRSRIKAAAEELSAKWGIFSADMFTVLKEASLSMPSTDIALGTGETMAKLFVVLESMFGREGAISGLYDINKALDNVEMNLTPEMYENAVQQYLKAQQVLGKDLSPQGFKQALQYARTAGKALSDDFLLTWLPIIAAETSGSDAGGQVRANFDQLIGGRATDKAKTQMATWGVTDGSGELVGRDVYDQNPVIWAHDVLLPLLQKAGIDTKNEVDLAQALAQLTNNRLSSDMLARSILSFEQYLRTATEYAPRAMGLDAAEEVRDLDPFAAATGMVNSLKNLAGALGEHVVPVIIPAMNAFASSVESVSSAVRDADGWQMGLAGLATVVGGFGVFKAGSALFGGIAALTTAGPSLQTAAIMLQGVATKMGTGPGGAVPPVGPTAPAGGGFNPTFALLAPWIATMIRDATIGPPTAEDREIIEGAAGRVFGRIYDFFDSPALADDASAAPGPYAGAANNPMMTGEFPDGQSAPWGGVDTSSIEQAGTAADATKAKLGGLNVTLVPHVDNSSLIAYEQRLLRVLGLQGKLGAVGPGQDVKSLINSHIRNMYADYGVTP